MGAKLLNLEATDETLNVLEPFLRVEFSPLNGSCRKANRALHPESHFEFLDEQGNWKQVRLIRSVVEMHWYYDTFAKVDVTDLYTKFRFTKKDIEKLASVDYVLTFYIEKRTTDAVLALLDAKKLANTLMTFFNAGNAAVVEQGMPIMQGYLFLGFNETLHDYAINTYRINWKEYKYTSGKGVERALLPKQYGLVFRNYRLQNYNAKPIIMIDGSQHGKKTYFRSAAEAARELGVSAMSINHVLQGRARTVARKYYFLYAADEANMEEILKKAIGRKTRSDKGKSRKDMTTLPLIN